MNFSAKYCTNFESVLDSEGFRRVLDVYLKKSEKNVTLSYRFLSDSLGSNDSHFIKTELLKLFKWLTIMDANEILEIESNYKAIFQDKQEFIKVVEDLYLFWRRLERYTIIQNDKIVGAVTHVLINKPDIGYGIYIEWMLEEAGIIE